LARVGLRQHSTATERSYNRTATTRRPIADANQTATATHSTATAPQTAPRTSPPARSAAQHRKRGRARGVSPSAAK